MSNAITKLTNAEVKFLEKLRNNRNEKGDRSFLSLLFSAIIPDKDTALKRLHSLFGDKYKDIFWGTWSEGEFCFCAKEIQNICSSIRDCLLGTVDDPDYKEEVVEYFREQFDLDYDDYIDKYKLFCAEQGLSYDELNLISEEDEAYFKSVVKS